MLVPIDEMITETETKRKQEDTMKTLNALYVRYPNGRNREPVYMACIGNGIVEEQHEVTAEEFNQLAALGHAIYQDGQYTAYDNDPIEWADVFSDPR